LHFVFGVVWVWYTFINGNPHFRRSAPSNLGLNMSGLIYPFSQPCHCCCQCDCGSFFKCLRREATDYLVFICIGSHKQDSNID
jgi:hypothetical protein